MIFRPVFFCLAYIAAAPVPAVAAETAASGKEFSFLYSFLQMIAALLLVVGLILLTYFITTRLIRKIPALHPANQYIRVVEVRSLGPRKSLLLVEVGGEYFLLSSCGDQLNLLKQVPVLEDIEIIETGSGESGFSALLKRAASIGQAQKP